MKKAILLIVLLCSISIVYAQQFEWGVKAGLNMANYADYPITSEARPSFHAGVQFQYLFTNSIGIETGIYYSKLKKKIDIFEISLDTQTKLKTENISNPSYLQLPIMALYKFRLNQNFYLYPTAGIYLGYGITGSNKTNTRTITPDKDQTTLYYSDYFNELNNKFDMGMSLGLNLQFKKITFGVGYDRGFVNILKEDISLTDEQNQYIPDSKVKFYNNNLKVSIGCLF